VGLKFTDLTMNDLDGQSRSLSEWCGKGNYVLVDFWASWCTPCRREMPNVVASYVKYHKKGYEVVGVSFDDKETAWKSAVNQMGMDWIQISDLKGWESAATSAYGEESIPSNVLLDPDGRIVASDLRGPQLEKKLKEIYGF
jgi:peroxiredoxin